MPQQRRRRRGSKNTGIQAAPKPEAGHAQVPPEPLAARQRGSLRQLVRERLLGAVLTLIGVGLFVLIVVLFAD